MSRKSTLGILQAIFRADTGQFSAGVKKVKGDTSEFQKRLRLLDRKLAKVQRSFDKTGKALTKNITAPLMAVGGLLIANTMRTANYADEIDKMSKRTQIGAEDLQELRFVMQQSGADFNSIGTAVRSFVTRCVFRLKPATCSG